MVTKKDLAGLPALDDTPAFRRHTSRTFTAYADEVITRWTQLQTEAAPRRAESANAWFKREAYRLIKFYVEAGLISTLRRISQRDERTHRLIEEAAKNPFKLGLMAMFSDDSLSRNNRHVFGNQMLYAWAHDVPPEFLNAFLAVSGGPAVIAEKLRKGVIEPGFEHRFVAERLSPIED